jgi:hypothetical protein
MELSRSRILDFDGQPLYLLWFVLDDAMLDEIRRCSREGEPLPDWPWEVAGEPVRGLGEAHPAGEFGGATGLGPGAGVVQ